MPSRKIEVQLVGDASDLERSLAGALAALKTFGAGADSTSTQTSKLGSSFKSLASNWKVLVPAVTAAGVAVLGFTGNLAVLAPLVPVLTAALAALLAPFTTLAALVVGFIPPVLLLTGLLGGLAAAFGIGMFKALSGTSPAFAHLQSIVEKLQGRFAGLARILAHDFMPIFMFLAGSAEQALNYLDKIAKLPLAAAFKNFSTVGVAGLQRFLDHVGKILAKPIRLAFGVAFGKSDTLRKALVDDWNDIMTFFTGKHGVLLPVEKWFGKQDFTATGMRWATELAGATMRALGAAFMKLFSSTGGKFILGGAGAGAAIGAALGGPIGAAMGLAIGAALGIALNHYWPKIKSAAITAFHAIEGAAKKAIGPKLWGQIGSLLQSFWDTLKAIGGFLKNDVYPVVKKVWDKLGGWHTIALILGGALRVIASIMVTIWGDVRTVYNWLKKAWDAVSPFARVVGGALLSAWNTVAGVVSTIVGAIRSAVGLAQTLASALGSSVPAATVRQHNLQIHHGTGVVAHASGGIGYRGQVSLVGEHGPELRVEGSTARYIPAGQTAAMLGGGGPAVLYLDLGAGIKQRIGLEWKQTARGLEARGKWGDS